MKTVAACAGLFVFLYVARNYEEPVKAALGFNAFFVAMCITGALCTSWVLHGTLKRVDLRTVPDWRDDTPSMIAFRQFSLRMLFWCVHLTLLAALAVTVATGLLTGTKNV